MKNNLMLDMENELNSLNNSFVKQAADKELVKVPGYLHSASEILDQLQLIKQSDQILNLLTKIANKEIDELKRSKKTTDQILNDLLNSDFSSAKDSTFDDLLEADIEERDRVEDIEKNEVLEDFEDEL